MIFWISSTYCIYAAAAGWRWCRHSFPICLIHHVIELTSNHGEYLRISQAIEALVLPDFIAQQIFYFSVGLVGDGLERIKLDATANQVFTVVISYVIL